MRAERPGGASPLTLCIAALAVVACGGRESMLSDDVEQNVKAVEMAFEAGDSARVCGEMHRLAARLYETADKVPPTLGPQLHDLAGQLQSRAMACASAPNDTAEPDLGGLQASWKSWLERFRSKTTREGSGWGRLFLWVLIFMGIIGTAILIRRLRP